MSSRAVTTASPRATRGAIDARTRARLAAVGGVALAVSAAVWATSVGSASRLGSPTCWPWLLTGLQVVCLWAAGAHRWWGWPLGAGAQLPWIVYALLTGQLGFIPGCVVSCAVQARTFLRGARAEPGASSIAHAPA